MLNAARRDGEDDNKKVRTALKRAGIVVNDSHPGFASPTRNPWWWMKRSRL